ncbi:MAG: hypothetical protein IT454_06445 [Planctomycetes bacterium]|nr:hypothetical protein [Planctomycetota bacterium]
MDRSRCRIRVLSTAASLALAAVLSACLHEPRAMPDELLGVWRASDRRYADRYVRIEPGGDLRWSQGAAGEQAVRVHDVEELALDGFERRFVVHYVDESGLESQLGLAFVEKRGLLYFGANRDVVWHKGSMPQ